MRELKESCENLKILARMIKRVPRVLIPVCQELSKGLVNGVTSVSHVEVFFCFFIPYPYGELFLTLKIPGPHFP